MAEIRIYGDADELARAAAEHFVSLAVESIWQRGLFAVALSGGSTPRTAYTLLASPKYAKKIDWTRVHLFWGDERCVPPEHPDSNYGLVHEALLKSVSIPEGNIHRMPGEEKPDEAARQYEDLLRGFFSTGSCFDLVLLGVGGDGHTASLFPGTKALGAPNRWVMANYVEPLGEWRLTLTAEVINTAGQVTFLASGEPKAEIVREILLGPRRPEELPAQLIKPPRGCLLWMLDAQAGELLE
jgi:6-phosphogluconolactonase